MTWFSKHLLSKQDLQLLSQKIADAESRTCGEIRVVLRHKRHRDERTLSLHDLALKEFHRLGMEKTQQRTGILILLLLSERSFHIIADEGIHTRVKDGTWDEIAAMMSDHFRKKNFTHGIAQAIEAVGKELSKHFPKKSGDTNQLPNDIVEE